MKQKWVIAMVPVAITLVALSGLLVLDPFRMLEEGFVKMGGAGREDAMVSSLYKIPKRKKSVTEPIPLKACENSKPIGAAPKTRRDSFCLVIRRRTQYCSLRRSKSRERRSVPIQTC